MIYKFKSKAASDLIMLGPNGDRLLRLIGREPQAKGIIEPQAMPTAMTDLKKAIAAEEAQRNERPSDSHPISLRQRLWPMIEMMKRAQAADEPIVWGV
jgi:hypothetical protein